MAKRKEKNEKRITDTAADKNWEDVKAKAKAKAMGKK